MWLSKNHFKNSDSIPMPDMDLCRIMHFQVQHPDANSHVSLGELKTTL